MALSLHEDEGSYSFLYQTLKEALIKYFNFDFQPQYSLTDAHKGQLKAIKEAFPNIVRLRCFFHLLQNIHRLIHTHGVRENTHYILWVTNCLKEAQSESEFLATWKILKPELKEMTKEKFVEEYEENYVKSEAKWFVGASFIGKQKTNNSLESINRYLKDNWTDRQSRSVPEFFQLMKSCFAYYNEKCNEETCMPAEARNRKEIFNKAEILVHKKQIYSIFPHLFAFFRIPKRDKKTKEVREQALTKKLEKVEERIKFYRLYHKNKFDCLINFTKIHCFFWFYDVNTDKCSCNKFMNEGICKHQIATLLSLKRVENAYSKKIQEASKVGRPRNLQK